VRRTALAGLIALLALPTAATAQDAPTGGLNASTTAPAATTPSDPAPVAATPTRASATLSGAGTWSAVPSKGTGSPLRIAGAFSPSLADRRVLVERRTPSGRWQRAASARVRSTGRFAATWRTRSTRVHELRVVLAPATDRRASTAASSRATADAPSVRIAVLGRAKATWYGPGLYGKTTACGVTLRPDTVGVAHRTLPCGTQVEIRRGGKTVVAPVIDRGPFANGATFDLTKTVADQVGVGGVDPVTFVQRDDLPRVATPAQAR
jgi:hypothetical protein